MNINIEVNKYDPKNVLTYGIEIKVYGKSDAKAKQIAEGLLKAVPQEDLSSE